MVESRKFSSPREEALDIAYTTRKNLLDAKMNVISLIRACLAVASNLNKSADEKWLKSELNGSWDSKVPEHRIVNCHYKHNGVLQRNPRFWDITIPISMLEAVREDAEATTMVGDNTIAILTPPLINLLISGIEDNCLFFLNNIIRELQYGGIVEYLMEEIRNNVDEKLAKLDENTSKEVDSLYTNLSSTNPADWTKVAHSCRRILKFVADKVFPASDKEYKMKNGSLLSVGEPQFINRLCAFADKKLGGDQRKFFIVETKYLENYLHQVVELTQKGEHDRTLEKFDADMIAIHTYLIISEILKLM
jgi:hypothetical protein